MMFKRTAFTLNQRLGGLALLLVLSGCDASGTTDASRSEPHTVAANSDSSTSPVDQLALINEVSASLQACSYDGEPVNFDGRSGNASSDCRDMVAKIMNFTGLPQNFVVVQADVPNAAAAILLDEQQIPQRVIAFNPQFIDVVRQATDGNAWAPVSIMAHEIGHHLSGHTITPGGSQPPTELEADKFSGFVLYKMGAGLDDAQTALEALVAEGPDGSTHPGRGKRLSAVREGWQQACVQQHGSCQNGQPTPSAAATPSASATTASNIKDASADVVTAAGAETEAGSSSPLNALGTNNANPPARILAGVDHLPAPGSIPSKFDRFIYDEYGLLDPSIRASYEAKFVEHARVHGVEIVSLLVRDLHGMKADAYAMAMMRELRVGKLDVGNGAVIVVAPDQGQVAFAWGPGIARQLGSSNPTRALGNWLQLGWPICARNKACGNWTENLLLTSDHIMRDTDEVEWTVRYQSVAAMMQARIDAAGGSSGDPTAQKIATFQGVVVARNVNADYDGAFVNSHRLAVNEAVHVRTDDGYQLMIYVVSGTESLMPAGPLMAGGHYQFIARSGGLSQNKKDTQEFELLSYSEKD